MLANPTTMRLDSTGVITEVEKPDEVRREGAEVTSTRLGEVLQRTLGLLAIQVNICT